MLNIVDVIQGKVGFTLESRRGSWWNAEAELLEGWIAKPATLIRGQKHQVAPLGLLVEENFNKDRFHGRDGKSEAAMRTEQKKQEYEAVSHLQLSRFSG